MSTFHGQQTQLSAPNTPDFTAHHASGRWERQPSPFAKYSSTPSLLASRAFPECARWERQHSHVRTLAPRLTRPIFRRTMCPHSERSHKTLYLQQLHVLHSQFSDAPCVHTAREATNPCTYNSTPSTLNSSTHPAPTQ